MHFTTLVSKAAIGQDLAGGPAEAVAADEREIVISIASRRAADSGWRVEHVLSYEEFDADDHAAARVTIDVRR